MKRRLVQLGALSLLLGGAACSSLLGIEDVHEGPAPGEEAGAGGVAQGGATNPNGGTSNAGTATGGTGQAGASHAGAGNPNGGAAGSGAAGGDRSGTGNDAGAGGASEGASPVHGHVIDFWGHFLSMVPVEIGGKQVFTDDNGAFSFDDVASEYDVSLIAQYQFFVTQTHAYVYQGLTRRDPTLQVLRGSEQRSGNFDVNYTGAAQSVTGTRSVTLAMGGPDGVFEKLQPTTTGSAFQAVWLGPDTTVEFAHALVWQDNAQTGVPEGYYAYGTASVALLSTTTDHSQITLDLTPKAITSSNLGGTVTPAGFADRVNTVSLRFTSGATIKLTQLNSSVPTFSYLVPTIANASVTLMASEGCLTDTSTGCALVHKDGLAGGGADFSVAIPTPAKTLTVTPAGAVTATTQFSFTPGTSGDGPYVSVMENSQSQNDRLYVISNKRPFKLPIVVNGTYAPVPGESYGWQVETHGSFTNVDQMTGTSGYMDAFSTKPADMQPRGARAGSGAYTISAKKAFTIAP
jgi:hypothetical protein